MAMIEEIQALKKERRATILAHNISDTGDSGHSRSGGRLTGALPGSSGPGLRSYCLLRGGLHGETAAILSPQKRVVLPVKGAYCPMAHMITPQQLDELKALPSSRSGGMLCELHRRDQGEKRHLLHLSQWVQVVESLSEDEVIFVPDRNLAAYVARHTKKKIIPWNGYCYVHDHFTPEMVKAALASFIPRQRFWSIRSAGRR